jgi:phosphatidylglycerophosphate synthase
MSTTESETELSGFAAAHQQLRNAQKTSKGAPAYSLYINRPLGRIFAAAAYQVGLTPNQVTMISAVFSFAGIGVLAVVPSSWWVGVGVCALLVIGYALDSADGQLARLRGGGSTVGEWLDHMIDCAKISTLHLAILIAAYRFFELPSLSWLLVPMVFTIVNAVLFFGMILNDQLARVHRAKHNLPAPPKEPASVVRTLLKVPTDYGFLCLSFILLGVPFAFFGVYTVLALGSTGYLLLASRKWFRDVAALDRPVQDGL